MREADAAAGEQQRGEGMDVRDDEIGTFAGFEVVFKALSWRTGTLLALVVESVSTSEGACSARESQVTASSKSSKAFTLQPRSLAMDANMLAR